MILDEATITGILALLGREAWAYLSYIAGFAWSQFRGVQLNSILRDYATALTLVISLFTYYGTKRHVKKMNEDLKKHINHSLNNKEATES